MLQRVGEWADEGRTNPISKLVKLPQLAGTDPVRLLSCSILHQTSHTRSVAIDLRRKADDPVRYQHRATPASPALTYSVTRPASSPSFAGKVPLRPLYASDLWKGAECCAILARAHTRRWSKVGAGWQVYVYIMSWSPSLSTHSSTT